MSKKKKPYWERGRDAITGQFIPVQEAKRRRKTAIVERVKRRKKNLATSG